MISASARNIALELVVRNWPSAQSRSWDTSSSDPCCGGAVAASGWPPKASSSDATVPAISRSWAARPNAAAAAHSTRASTRSRWRRHTSCATRDPIEKPTGTNVSMPRASASAATSSAQSSSRNRGEVMPEPCQRWSNTTTRPKPRISSSDGYQVKSPVHATACNKTNVGPFAAGPESTT